MSASQDSEFLLLFRGTDWAKDLSPEQMQGEGDKFMAWFERLKREGKCKGGQPLKPAGRVVTGAGGRTVVDGPFAEAKETVGGYFLILAPDMDAAVKIAQGCPGLPGGMIVEVRPVAEQCPYLEGAEKAMAHAAA